MKKINVFLYLFFLLVLINVSILDAMSLKVYAPVVGALFTVNRPRMFSAACGIVGMDRRFPLSMVQNMTWQNVNMHQANDYRERSKNINYLCYLPR